MELAFQFQPVWDIILSGGWVMIPLALLAMMIYTTAFQLLIYVRKGSVTNEHAEKWRDWLENPAEAQGRVGDIIRYVQRVEDERQLRNRFEEVRLALTALIDRRLAFLRTLVSAAPLLGLLGTVLGMLTMFGGISRQAGGETATIVAEGISEALITTQTGLVIALPGLFLAMIIQRQKHAIEATLARLESIALTQKNFVE